MKIVVPTLKSTCLFRVRVSLATRPDNQLQATRRKRGLTAVLLSTREPKETCRDSSVGIATRYGLDGQGIESWWEVRFSAPVQTGPRPTQPPIQWVPDLSLG